MTPPEKPRAAPQQIDWAGSRRLLRLLRDAMKSGGPVQTRLDNVVKIIAANLVAEVCSIYAMRAGEVLELFATQGLKPEAVHTTRLSLGEGLVAEGEASSAYNPQVEFSLMKERLAQLQQRSRKP